jgi:hypothetical protein
MGWRRGDEGSEVYVVVDSAANFYAWYRLLQSVAQIKPHWRLIMLYKKMPAPAMKKRWRGHYVFLHGGMRHRKRGSIC